MRLWRIQSALHQWLPDTRPERRDRVPVCLVTMNFDPHSSARLSSGRVAGVDIVDVANPANDTTGFAENHNALFARCPPHGPFVVINPDCTPHEGAIDRLLKRKSSADIPAAIVEGRQWPLEHPKEYDTLSLWTPWASCAFSLIDADSTAPSGAWTTSTASISRMSTSRGRLG